jgi:RES domain-containing protein
MPPGGGDPETARATEQAPVTFWRITSRRHVKGAFSGEGARLYGGRWNLPGTPIVYTSPTLSLCALEYFVHVDPGLAPAGLVAIAVDLPSGISIPSLAVAELPDGWRRYPAPERLQDIGTAWALAATSAALRVPSAIIPHEHNVLLNPRHADFQRLRPRPAEPFAFDPRMWK